MRALVSPASQVDLEAVCDTAQALAAEISLQPRFKLFFAVCNGPADREWLIGLLGEFRPGARIRFARMDEHTRDPLEETLSQIDPALNAPVMLTGLERAIRPEHGVRPALDALNRRSAEWPARVPHSVVLWAPAYVLDLLDRDAPFFYRWIRDIAVFPPLLGSAAPSPSFEPAAYAPPKLAGAFAGAALARW